MRIDIGRISGKLAVHSFRLAYFDEETLEAVFVKPFLAGLFERIEIGQGWERGGRHGDLVTASVQCAVVPGRTCYKGMGEIRCLIEIASEPSTGWSILKTAEEAILWENRLASVGPERSRALCVEVGADILVSTESVRHVANACLNSCRKLAFSPGDLIATLKLKAEEWQLDEWRRILACPIPCLPNGRVFCEIAVLAIVLYSGEVKGDYEWFVGQNHESWTNRELMSMIQYMQSVLAEEPGWPEPFWPTAEAGIRRENLT